MNKDTRVEPQDIPVERTVDIPIPSKDADKASGLYLVATQTVGLIPRGLLERSICAPLDSMAIDRIYRCAAGLGSSPSNLFYLLMDNNHEIHGFAWIHIDVIRAELSVYGFAIDEKYDDGDWIRRLTVMLYQQPFDWPHLSPDVVWLVPFERVRNIPGMVPQLDAVQRISIPRSAVKCLGDGL